MSNEPPAWTHTFVGRGKPAKKGKAKPKADARKAANDHARACGRFFPKWYWGAFAKSDFLAGVRWERRRAKREKA